MLKEPFVVRSGLFLTVAIMTIPDTFYCPITKRIMHYPVMDPEGHSYERTAIIRWLRDHHTSPITRHPLEESELTTNFALKDAIETMKAELGDDWTVVTETGMNTNTDGGQDSSLVPTVSQLRTASIDTPVDINALLRADGDGNLLVTIKSPVGGERVPVDLVCVIDVSGSMDEMADIKKYDENGVETVESTGLTTLDVVKHALKMIIASLSNNDRLGLVTFSDAGQREFPLTVMNGPGKTRVTSIVERWYTRGCTNLWHGLQVGMDVIREAREASSTSLRMGSLFLLTDGQPNITPPRGEIESLKRYLDTHGLTCSINTFGFGYSLDSVMLDKLAVIGNGQYSFIPDAGMVGTVFIHTLANLFVTVANNVRLRIEPIEALTISRVGGDDSNAEERSSIPNFFQYVVGTLQLEQTKDILFHVTGPMSVRVTLDYDVWNTMTTQTKAYDQTEILPIDTEDDRRYLSMHKNRLTAVDVLRYGMSNSDDAIAKIAQLSSAIKSSISGALPEMVDLVLDLDKEGTIAFDSEKRYFRRWGRHYIPSLSRTHFLQMCNNFKDPGVQHYGGILFKISRDALDEIFNTLPPVRPSRPVYDRPSGRHVYRRAVNMSMYNVSSDPCFLGSCTVMMKDNVKKRVDELKKGDVLSSGVTVRCILKTNLIGGKADVVRLKAFKNENMAEKDDKGELFVTPWHPVYDLEKMKWRFPAEIGSIVTIKTDALYSILLGSLHIMDINEIPCVTLGHENIGSVLKHPFFGSQAVVKEMKRFPGFEDGLVEISGTRRDTRTGLVNGFKFSTAYVM